MNIFANLLTSVTYAILIGLSIVATPDNTYCQSDTHTNILETNDMTEDSLSRLIENYSIGFVNNDFNKIRKSIGQQLTMINGNYSGEPIDWQAHQFLNGEQIDNWITMMLNNAMPFENEVKIINISIRGNSAIVVTKEKGKNKFRNWKKEEVVYMLGKSSGKWGIVGIFIKNLKNPD